MRRAVVTGLGTINPLANDVPEFWQAACGGRSGVDQISLFDASGFRTSIAAEVKQFRPDESFDVKQAKRMDRYAQFALVAAIEAVKDAGLELETENPDKIGVIVGTGIGGMRSFEDECNKSWKAGPGRISPFMVPRIMPNGGVAAISLHFGLTGPSFSSSSACASSADAITLARDFIRAGRGDVVVTGGAEAAITPVGIGGFCAARSLSERNSAPQAASRPFDQDRDGFVLGEGAGILVVEEYEHARRRNAPIYCEITGCGQTSDAYHITAPDPTGRGAARAMKSALSEAALGPEEIDYLNAHATSTPLGDLAETKAIQDAFGQYANQLTVSCTKSMIGHLCGASGSVAAIVLALTIAHGMVHPTINVEAQDPECDLDITPNVAREKRVRHAMLNSFGFGGHNASLLFSAI